MGENTDIEWATHTQNFWMGCTEVSPACDHCYARVMMDEHYGKVKWGAGQPRVRTSKENWRKPFSWNKKAAAAGRRDTVFCLSLGDIWDNEVEPAWRREAFDIMRATPSLVWLLLSKRIGNAGAMADAAGGLPPNDALGATMINQPEWDRDSERLAYADDELDPLFTFASVEPMLGNILIGDWCPDWVICGGESGPGARDMSSQWAWNLKTQVHMRKKAFFMKQMARKAPIPADIFVREFPPAIVA